MLLVPRSVDKEEIVPIEDKSFKSVFDTIKTSENNRNSKTRNDKFEKEEERRK